jgi:polysaccharide export outer membrane protein
MKPVMIWARNRTRRRWLTLALILGVIVSSGACAWMPSNPFVRDTPPPVPAPRVVGEVEDYVIGVPDQLEITVWQHPEFSGPALVRRDGKISVPLMGDIQAEGTTPEALALAIQRALSDFIAKPQVDVAVTEMGSQIASVIGGGVVRSGTVALLANTRVIDAIAEMGGFTPFAKKHRILILRDTPEGQVEYVFDYSAFIKGRAPASNIVLMPGDTVVVPE